VKLEDSLLCPQEPATDRYRETYKSSSHPHPVSLRSILILSSHLRLGLTRDLLSLGFPMKFVHAFSVCPTSATCTASCYVISLLVSDIVFSTVLMGILIFYQFFSDYAYNFLLL
jgi:hypothetical protein